MNNVTYSKDSIWDIVGKALETPRCVCGCGRWSSENTFATPECFNKEEADCVY
jgi:hypothetical protein